MKKLPQQFNFRTLALAVASSLVLTACNGFVPLERLQMKGQIAGDRQAAQDHVAPIEGGVTVEEAIARALKYNLDRRAKEMEVNLASGQYKAALFQALPKVNAQADYSSRSNDRVTLNRDGTPNSIAQDRTHTVSEYGVSWNLLEFGLGYFNAKQAGERIQIAEERRRKAVYALIQDVRSAYWRSACAQVMRDRLKENIKLAEEALEAAQKVESQRLRSPQDELAYQRQLLENLRMLEAVQQELSTAQIELASLINAPVGQLFELKFELPKTSDALLEYPIEKLEELALENNADLRESHHQSQIARIETRKILAQLFPSLSFNVSSKYDTDSFQANQRWNDVGVRLSYNLVSLLSVPTQIELGKVGVELADQRRVMTQMAVLTQVHVARLNLINSSKQLSRTSKIRELDRRLAALSGAREKAGTRGKLETISTSTTALLSEFRSYQAIAQAQVAESRLSAVVGLEFYANNMNAIELSDLVSEIANSPDEVVRKIQSFEQETVVPAIEQSEPLVTQTTEQPAQEPKQEMVIEPPKEALPANEPVPAQPVEVVQPVVEVKSEEVPAQSMQVESEPVEPVVPVQSMDAQTVFVEPPATETAPAAEASSKEDVAQMATEQPVAEQLLVEQVTKTAEPETQVPALAVNPEEPPKVEVKAEAKVDAVEAKSQSTELVELQAQIEAEAKVEAKPAVVQAEAQLNQTTQDNQQSVAKKSADEDVELMPLSVEASETQRAANSKEKKNEAVR